MSRLLLAIAAGAGLVLASASLGLACEFHNAGHDTKMTVAEKPAEASEQAASTFDPEKLKVEDEKKAE